MKTLLVLTMLGIMGIILFLTFFSPVIIMLVTGNPWFLLLFLVSYIPVWGEAIVFGAMLSLIN